MADLISTATRMLLPAFSTVTGGRDIDPIVRASDHADLQANGALQAATRLGRDPRQVAEEIVAITDAGDVATLEAAGPGFINITFSNAFLCEHLASIANDPRLGVQPPRRVETVVIDYSAPNVAKEMHVGHLRTTVLGDALAHLYEFDGHRVIRENHIGDWGTPFGMLIEHLIDEAGPETAADFTISDLDTFYKDARLKFDTDEDFRARARRRVATLQGRQDPATMDLWRVLVAESNRHFSHLYARLDILLTDADLAGESTYHSLMPDVLARLAGAGLLTESDGARVVFAPGFCNREGSPLPLIVQARTGGYTYATSDLACLIDRVERLKATLLLYVVGSEQAQHLQMVWTVAELAGWLRRPTRAVHVGLVLDGRRKRLRSRGGDPIKFIDLVDEAIERGRRIVAARAPDLPDNDLNELGRVIGLGALKYAELSTDRIKDYVFDWNRMLAFDGNTAPYLQYAHARVHSLLRRANTTSKELDSATFRIATPHEHQLALRLLSYDAAIRQTLQQARPTDCAHTCSTSPAPSLPLRERPCFDG